MAGNSGTLDFADCGLVVVAAGQGARFGGYKQLATVEGLPLIVRTLLAFSSCRFADRVVVLPPGFLAEGTWDGLVARHREIADYRPVPGADRRALSVRAGLEVLADNCELVVVHDGARPFPPIETTWRCCERLRNEPGLGGATVAATITDTVKEIEQESGIVIQTLDRRQLRRAETPQVARLRLLKACFHDEEAGRASDEAALLEMTGHSVATLLHEGFNPKITVARDVILAETYLRLIAVKSTEGSR